jgi:hypothetical protein
LTAHSEPPNPYASTSDVSFQPEMISFDGVVDESMYLSLVPRRDKYIVLPIALFIGLVVIPIILLGLFYSLFIEWQLDIVAVSVGLLAVMIAALVFCIRIASVRRRTCSYLAKFPDLLGPMQGTISKSGLLLRDEEKTHWFPWVQLSKMAISNAGVRIPLSDDPRRFLALGEDLFNGFRPHEIRLMLFANRVSKIPMEQLIAESAAAFEQSVESPSFYNGIVDHSLSWREKLATMLMGPVLGAGVLVWLVMIGPNHRWTRYLPIAMTIYFLLPKLVDCIKLARGQLIKRSQYWGWLTADDLIYGSGVHVMKVPLALLKCVLLNEETLDFRLPSGTSLFVFRMHFQDATNFDRIVELTKSRQAVGE